MNKTQKDNLAADLKDKFSKAKIAIFADYKGLSAGQADEFRRILRAENAIVKVLKNNIARKVAEKEKFSAEAKAVMDELVGPTMVAFGFGDIAKTAKAVHKFSETNEAFKLKDGVMGMSRVRAEDIEALAKLPSREVLLSMLLSAMNGPARGFVSVLAAVPRGLVTVLDAIEKKKADAQ